MDRLESLCMGCMKDIGEETVCPYCKENRRRLQKLPFLQKESRLSERYIVGKALEINGEGSSYIGYDTEQKTPVYVKEFLPPNLCSRDSDSMDVKISEVNREKFNAELEKFLKYFRSVARLRNLSSIVAVYDIFKANNTAYVIFEWIEGMKLDKYITERGGHIKWDDARGMFLPLLSSLNDMHSANVLHLGICPKNMFVMPSGKIKLSGFAIRDLRKNGSIIESQLYDGCSAIEQYLDMYDVDNSTDVYGFTSTLFFALTGEYPPKALDRKKDDRLLMPHDLVKTFPSNVISGIASALRVYPNNRTLSFERMRAELSDSPISHIIEQEQVNVEVTPEKKKKEKKKNSNFILGILSCIVSLIVLVICLAVYWFGWKQDGNSKSKSTENSSQSINIGENLNSLQNQGNIGKISVLNLIGKNMKAAQEEAEKSGSYRILLLSEEFSDKVPEGCITSQTPGAGEEIEVNSAIAVNVSKGKKMRPLPSISGKSLSEASATVISSKLRPIEVREYSNNVPEGIAIGYKNYKPGDTVEYGSKVTIVISKGKK